MGVQANHARLESVPLRLTSSFGTDSRSGRELCSCFSILLDDRRFRSGAALSSVLCGGCFVCYSASQQSVCSLW